MKQWIERVVLNEFYIGVIWRTVPGGASTSTKSVPTVKIHVLRYALFHLSNGYTTMGNAYTETLSEVGVLCLVLCVLLVMEREYWLLYFNCLPDVVLL